MMMFVGLFSVLILLLGSLANNHEMSLNPANTFQSNWGLTPKYRQDEIVFQDLEKEGNQNKYDMNVYESRPHDSDTFKDENYRSGKYFEKDLTYLDPNENDREVQPPIRSVNSRYKNFVPICRTIRKTRRIRNELKSEYRPETIDEYVCVHPYNDQDSNYNQYKNKVCGIAGFHCVQRYANIHVSHKPYDSNLWHVETYRIANGCDCMWPTQIYGDIERYHYNNENNTKYRCRPIGSDY